MLPPSVDHIDFPKLEHDTFRTKLSQKWPSTINLAYCPRKIPVLNPSLLRHQILSELNLLGSSHFVNWYHSFENAYRTLFLRKDQDRVQRRTDQNCTYRVIITKHTRCLTYRRLSATVIIVVTTPAPCTATTSSSPAPNLRSLVHRRSST